MTVMRRVEWTGVIRTLEPLAIGGGELGDVDLAPVLDGDDKVFLPGTSLTGVARSLLEPTLQGAFGSQDRASTIEIDDAPLKDGGPLELRDGVGIDRNRGAAAPGIKYTRLVVPAGSTFDFRLTAEVEDPDSLDPIVAIFADPDGAFLGVSTTRGLGRVVLEEPRRRVTPLDRRGMLAWLAGNGQWTERNPGIANSGSRSPETLEVPWTARGPVFVRSGVEGLAVDDLPLVARRDGRVHLFIPGSSLKGVLRTHAERIERTLRGIDASGDFLEQVNDPRLVVTGRLFGTAADGGQGRRGALSMENCWSLWNCSTAEWDSVLNAATCPEPDRLAALRAAIEELPTERGEMQVGFHVGLDRWTSAPVDGALYSTIEPWGVVWEPFTIRLDHHLLGDDQVGDAGRFLLLLLLRDLCEGWLALGHGAWRGYGSIVGSAGTVLLDEARWGAGSLGTLLATPDVADVFRDAWRRELEGEAP